jgi:predicted enzyme related to lactoylglutathione lyase
MLAYEVYRPYKLSENSKKGGKKMKIQQVLTRIYLSREELEASVAFYESLFRERSLVRFAYPEAGLELAQVGSLLLIAGEATTLEPFKATQATFLVDALSEWKDFLLQSGATLLKEPKHVPTGMNMLVKHPDGTRVEYVQHVKEQVDAVNIAHKAKA